MTSVLIIDKHPISSQGGRLILEEAGVEQVLITSSLVDGYQLYLRHDPDVVIVDPAVAGGGLAGLDFILRIMAHDAQARVIVFSMHDDPTIVTRFLEAGASGYVLKDSASADLVKAVQSPSTFLSADIAMKAAVHRSSAKQHATPDVARVVDVGASAYRLTCERRGGGRSDGTPALRS
jgi:two-component system invasion response regulator UvrY